MTKLLRWLVAIQVVGMIVAATAAAVEIESILVTGSVLTFTGLLIVILSFHREFELGFYYGLSVLGVPVIAFSMIFGFEWGPRDAAVPISSLLFMSCLGTTPLGVLAFREIRRAAFGKRSFGPPFNLVALVVLIAFVSIAFGLSLAASNGAAACAVIVAYLVIVSFATTSFQRPRSSDAQDGGRQ